LQGGLLADKSHSSDQVYTTDELTMNV